MNSSSRSCRNRSSPPAMWSSCICIAAPLSLLWLMRMPSRTPIGGAATQPGGRNAGRWCRNGCGTCAWSWGISFILTRCVPLNLLLPSRLRHRTRLPPRAMLPLRWACPGKLAASPAKTLLSSPMGHCVAPLTRSCSRMSNAEKPMAACAWCMAPAFTVVVPVRCASSVNGMAVRRQSRAREVGCCIRSRWVQPHCGFALLPPESPPARLSATGATPTHRGEPAASCRRFVRQSGRDPVSPTTRALSSLLAGAAGSQCSCFNIWASDDQTVWCPRKLCHLARVGNGLSSS